MKKKKTTAPSGHGVWALLTASQVDRIYRLTDTLRLHRDWVVVPLRSHETGLELLQPDGKLLIHPPFGEQFEPWFLGLKERLEGLPLGEIPRMDDLDPKASLASIGAPRFYGTHGYLEGKVRPEGEEPFLRP
jgi:hypothetical protein